MEGATGGLVAERKGKQSLAHTACSAGGAARAHGCHEGRTGRRHWRAADGVDATCTRAQEQEQHAGDRVSHSQLHSMPHMHSAAPRGCLSAHLHSSVPWGSLCACVLAGQLPWGSGSTAVSVSGTRCWHAPCSSSQL
jgi:hypothetical protein